MRKQVHLPSIVALLVLIQLLTNTQVDAFQTHHRIVSSPKNQHIAKHHGVSKLVPSSRRYSPIFADPIAADGDDASLPLPPEGGLEQKESTEQRNNKAGSLTQRIRGYFFPNDGLSSKQRLAKMGLTALLSYGWVSNMSYCVSVSAAWYIFSRNTGLSPIAPGQWKNFLAIYAGFWVFNNIVRPIRVAVALAIAPQFEQFITSLQDRFRMSKTAAVATTVTLANLIGTTATMAAGILLASILSGVPVFPPKP